MADALHFPSLRNQADPGDAGVLEVGVGVEAAGDGAIDEDAHIVFTAMSPTSQSLEPS